MKNIASVFPKKLSWVTKAPLSLWLLIGVVALILVAVAAHKKATDQRIMSLYQGFNLDHQRCDALYANGRYGELVDLFEEESKRFDATVENLGGMDKIAKRVGHAKDDPGNGMSDLFGCLQFTMPHNSRFIDKSIHMFLMDATVFGTRDLTSDDVEFATHLSRSKHPMLKSYGLWIMKERELRVNKLQYSKDIGDILNYPDIEGYRRYAYEHALRGEAWAFGFAADASRYDSDTLRALGYLEIFESTMTKDKNSAYYLPYVDSKLCEWVCLMAEKSAEAFKNLDGKQTAFLNRILDRAIRTEDVFADSNKIRLFQIMNREADIPTYEEQVKRNFGDWQPMGGKRRGSGRDVVEGTTEGE